MSTEHDIQRIEDTLVRHENRQKDTESTLLQIAVQLKENAVIQQNLLEKLKDPVAGLPAIHQRVQSLERIRWKFTGAFMLAVVMWTVVSKGLDWIIPGERPVTLRDLQQVVGRK